MKNLIAICGLAAALAGCSGAEQPTTAKTAAGPRHDGGLWETRVYIGGEQMPDTPRVCVKVGVFDPLSRFSQDAGCAQVARTQTGDGYTFEAACVQDGVTSRTKGSAKVGKDAVVLTTRSTMDGADQAMEMRLESRRLGPCPAGMAVVDAD
ncbi:MAG: DUF3617 domain-containing protein [Phenylobacterium sp.]